MQRESIITERSIIILESIITGVLYKEQDALSNISLTGSGP